MSGLLRGGRAPFGLARRLYAGCRLTDGRIRWLDAGYPGLVELASEVVEAYIAERREGREW